MSLLRALQFANALDPMLVSCEGNPTVESFEQLKKVPSLMAARVSGRSRRESS